MVSKAYTTLLRSRAEASMKFRLFSWNREFHQITP
jgi:hypothetical protein